MTINCPTCDGTGQVEGVYQVTMSDGDVCEWPTHYRDGVPLPVVGEEDSPGVTVTHVSEEVPGG